MALSLSGSVDYSAVLADLERRLRDGQAKFDAWEVERIQLEQALSSVRPIAASLGQLSLAFSPTTGQPVPVSGNHVPSSFEGLGYRQAVLKVFAMLMRPTSAPEVADILHKHHYNGSARKTIKNNVDGTFRLLREDNVLRKTEDGRYEVASRPHGPK